MQIEHDEAYERFMDSVKLSLLVWRRKGGGDFAEISRKLGISERTVRRRCNSPESLTLGELFAWCELYGKDPAALLQQAYLDSKK